MKLQFNIKIGRHLVFLFMVVSLREISRSVFRTLSNDYEVFLAEVVNVFQPFTIFTKKLGYGFISIELNLFHCSIYGTNYYHWFCRKFKDFITAA